MSPHNYNMKFNGSKGINVSDQEEYAEKANKVLKDIGMFIYRVSGLQSFFTRRFFERGISNNPISHSDQVDPYLVDEIWGGNKK